MTSTNTTTCGAHEKLWEFFVSGDFIVGWDCTMTGGDPATQLFMFGVIFGAVELALFTISGSVVIPAMVAILMGGVMFSLLPASFVTFGLVAVLMLLGGLGLLIAFRSGT